MTTLFSYLLYFLIAVLVLLLVREFQFAMHSIRALRWRRAVGRIVGADLASGDREPNAPASRVEYEFSAEETGYRSSQVGFGFPERLERLIARDLVDSIVAKGPDVTVFYDPRKPADSILIAGFQPFHGCRIGACIGALIVLYALTFVV